MSVEEVAVVGELEVAVAAAAVAADTAAGLN